MPASRFLIFLMSENLREQLALLPGYFQGHLVLTLISLSAGIVLSIPLGIWASQSALVRKPVLAVVSIIQTIPSVAILAMMVALLGGAHWPVTGGYCVVALQYAANRAQYGDRAGNCLGRRS
jgi:ABC-type proline/glycine betaine transport system permease subunit